ncbi:MAG: hypothetical protein LQ352_004988 [Teloschistes flavicans]|nr:MAG: hypothetical protein LQ352_004988 [Teloschistes flavicans]
MERLSRTSNLHLVSPCWCFNSSTPTTPVSPTPPVSKQANGTLLKAAPPFLKAILDPADKTFSRLECPSLNSDRYAYLRPGGNQTNAPEAANTIKYYFALDLYQCADLLPRLLGSIVESMRFLGPQHCALSLVEGRSDDGTFEILHLLQQEIEKMGAKYFLQTNEVNPRAEGVNRIEALANLRNQALQPLIHAHAGKGEDITVAFVNDVAICVNDVLELIHQRRHQNADMVCAMDWTYVGPDPTFYDVWIARGMNGDSFFLIPDDGNWNSAWNIFWNNPDASQKLRAGKPFQVFSCWNGAVVFTARPVVEQKIKFRWGSEEECPQGEPKSFCQDMWTHGYGKIAVVPSVNLEYSDEAGKKIKAAKGYVSDFMGRGAGENDRIGWVEEPPEKVKCIPNYQNQHWRPWNDKTAINTTA